MGASEGFQSLYGHSSDLTLPLFSLQLRVLKDWYEFEYWLDHLCHVVLVCSFHSMSLSCFLPKALIFLPWLDTSFHFAITYLMLWDMFIDHLFTLYTYHGLNTPFFVGSLVQFSTRRSYFHYKKVKGTFLHSHFFRESCLDHLTIFLSYGARVEG